MKIVSTVLDPKYIGLLGCMTVLLKDEFHVWKPDVKPIYDMIGQIKPDIIMMMSEEVNQSTINALTDYPCKFILFGSGVPEAITKIKLPSILCAPASLPVGIRKNLENNIFPVEYLSDYANIAQIFNGVYDETIDADVTYISHHPIGQRYYIPEMLGELKGKGINLKIVGQHRIPLTEYLGTINTIEIPNILASSKITIDFDGQILLDAAANKTFVMSNIHNGLFPSFKNSRDLCNGLIGYIRSPEYRKRKVSEAYKSIIKNDTSFHRIIQIFSAIKEQEIVDLATNKLEELV